MWDSKDHLAASGSSTGSGQRAGCLAVPSYGAHHGVEPGREVGETSFPDGQDAEDLFASAGITHLPLWYSRAFRPETIAPNALLQQWTGLSLSFFPVFSADGQNPGKDTGARGGGGDSLSPHVAEEVLVHPPAVGI